jgi:CopG family transcriptional regulator, nickel-responsive regulator
MSDLERVSITIERELLLRFDELLDEAELGNRSEALRDLIRRRLDERAALDDERPATGALTMLYVHGRRELEERLTGIGHEHHELVRASMHVHLDHHHCLEVVALTGRMGELRRLGAAMGGLKGVLGSQLALVPTPDDAHPEH